MANARTYSTAASRTTRSSRNASQRRGTTTRAESRSSARNNANNTSSARSSRDNHNTSSARSSRNSRNNTRGNTRTDTRATARNDESRAAVEVATKPTLRDKMDSWKKSRTKDKAGKAFEKQFGGDTGANTGASAGGSEGGSRAAVYKAEMGSSHKRATRMQNSAAPSAPKARKGRTASDDKEPKSRRGLMIFGTVAICIALCCVFLYPVAQQYYKSIREEARLEAEYAAVTARNEALKSEVNSLSTSSGIEAKAHEDYGWVKEGDQVVMVQGVHDNAGEAATDVNASVDSSTIKAPVTWYSPVLDVIFGVK